MHFHLHNLVESVQVHLGHAPSCAWVEERLIAYCDWDLPEHEFRAIERHLARCPACKREYDEVVALIESIHEQLAPTQFGAAAAAEFAAGVMARIDAYEHTRAAAAVRGGAPWTQPRLVRLAAACAVLLVLLAGAFLVVRASRGRGAAGCAGPLAACGESASAPASPHGVCSGQTGPNAAETLANLPDLGLREDLDAEVSRTLAILESEALLPHTDQELEAWARKEYPDVMWLCDLLRTDFGYAGSWRELLRDSGMLLRFDWPTAKGQPNCRPSLAAVQAAASVAGYEVTLGGDGHFALPELAWADVDGDVGRVRVHRLPEVSVALAGPGRPPRPEGYAEMLAADPSLAEPVLAYLAVSSALVGAPEFDRLAADCKAILGEGRMPAAQGTAHCAATCMAVARFQDVLKTREHLLEAKL
jgi:hypothetical protein